jgi:hypothetical protein
MLNGENYGDNNNNNNNNNNNKTIDKMTSDVTKLIPSLTFTAFFLRACFHFCFFTISPSSHPPERVV